MKKLTLSWILFVLATTAHAQEPLQFMAEIKNEELAEDAIQLLQCVSDRMGAHWELTESVTGPYSLTAKETTNGSLNIRYRAHDKEFHAVMARGQFEKVCDSIAPEQKVALMPPTPEEPFLAIEPAASPRRVWIWAGAAAVVLGGYLLWKSSRKPSYATVTLH